MGIWCRVLIDPCRTFLSQFTFQTLLNLFKASHLHSKNISSFSGFQFFAAKRNTASVFMCSGMLLQRVGARAFGVLIPNHACNSWMTVFYIPTWFSVAAEIPLFGGSEKVQGSDQ